MKTFLYGMLLFLLFIIFVIKHRIKVKMDALNFYLYIDFLPFIIVHDGKFLKWVLKQIVETKKINVETISFFHLLEPVENVYVKVIQQSESQINTDIYMISFLSILKSVVPVDVAYQSKEGEFNTGIEISLSVYIPSFISHIQKIRGEINERKKLKQHHNNIN